MGLIWKLSYRNLLRQKKRNILLGLGISFGMMVIVIANSFAHGMMEVLIRDVVTASFGHLRIDCRTGNSDYYIIRDKQRIENLIKATIKPADLKDLDESVEMLGRAIGNGATDNVYVCGIDAADQRERQAFLRNYFTLVAGNLDDVFSKRIEYPAIISEKKAKSLNVKVHDVVRVRLPMVTGQIQVAKLTVIAIANSNNTFMDIVLFMDTQRVKKLLGYKPWEAASFQITLKDPQKNAKYYAELLHQKLQPHLLSIVGKLENEPCLIFAFQNNDTAKKSLPKEFRLIQGDWTQGLAKKGVLLSATLAQKLNIKVGDTLTYRYATKYRGIYEERFKVNAIVNSVAGLDPSIMLVNEERIHDAYDRYLPAQTNVKAIAANNPFSKLLATEWKLLERSADVTALQRKIKRERRIKTDQAKLDVITMYEGASEILKLEGLMNLITFSAVLVLFFIILIGVVNTLRMTIKERTREIGTIRAVGMQKRDVRNMFVLETLQLTALACIAGLVLGMVVILLLGTIRFDIDNYLSIILKDKHLNFKINPLGLVANFSLIMFVAGITAYFPARRAAKLSAVEALRSYE